MQENSCKTLDAADIHGVKHITATDIGLVRRIVWIVAFLASAVFLLYQCISSIIYYVERHHVTKTDVNYTSELEFPAVTLCNFNKYRESAFTERDIGEVGIHLGVVDENYVVINPHLYTEEFVNRVHSFSWSNTSTYDSSYNMTDFVVRTGHQAKHMILKCEYSGDECFYSNFSHVNTHHGNCYTFNKWEEGRGPLISKRAGAGNGLKLILDIELEEYTPSNDLDGDSMDAGLKILIHPTNEPPYVKELGFALTPGYHSFISMKKELITGLPVPYGECLKDGNIQYHDHYSLSACRIECETLAVQTECGCRLVEQPGDLPVCTASQTHHCAHQTLVDFVDGHLDVDCSCADPCTVEDYPHVITMAKLRPAFIEKMFHDTEHNMTEEYIQENVIVLSIFYEGLNLQTITQLPDTDVIVLVSQIGGNMGLCLGASILTILELLEFALDYIASKCKLLVSRYQKRRIIHVKPAVEVNEEKKEIRPTVVN